MLTMARLNGNALFLAALAIALASCTDAACGPGTVMDETKGWCVVKPNVDAAPRFRRATQPSIATQNGRVVISGDKDVCLKSGDSELCLTNQTKAAAEEASTVTRMQSNVKNLTAALAKEKAARAQENVAAGKRGQEAEKRDKDATEERNNLQVLLKSTSEKLLAVSKHLSRLDAIDIKAVVRLTCIGTNYIDPDGKCISCKKAGPYIVNAKLGVCQPCAASTHHYLKDKKICMLLTQCKTTDYAKVEATATSNRVCAKVTVCTSTQWEASKPAVGKDRVCKEYSRKCLHFEKEITAASKTNDRLCGSSFRSCAQLWGSVSSTRSSNGWYNFVKYQRQSDKDDTSLVTVRKASNVWIKENCGDGGYIAWGADTTATIDMGAPSYLTEVIWYSVYQGGPRGCIWYIQGSNDKSRWDQFSSFNFYTYSELHEANGRGRWQRGAQVNSAPNGAKCARYSGSYIYSNTRGFNNYNKQYRYYRLKRGRVTRGHCPRVSSLKWSARKATTKPHYYKAYCDMKKGGWQLAYNRNSLLFTPDHMHNKCPEAGGAAAALDTDSTSWCVPDMANRWKWEVALADSDPKKEPADSAFERIITNVPHWATYKLGGAKGSGNVANEFVKVYINDVLGASTKMYYQRYTAKNGAPWSCSSSKAAWFGLVREAQGNKDRYPAGIGGHCDTSCKMNGKGYTFGADDVEYYLGKNTKDAYSCKGGGGTACLPCNDKSRYGYRFRIWTQE